MELKLAACLQCRCGLYYKTLQIFGLNCQSCKLVIKFKMPRCYCKNMVTVGALSCCLWLTPPSWDLRRLKQAVWTGLSSAAQRSSLTAAGNNITVCSVHQACWSFTASPCRVSSEIWLSAEVMHSYETFIINAFVVSSYWHHLGCDFLILDGCSDIQSWATLDQMNKITFYKTEILRVAEIIDTFYSSVCML